MFVDQPPDCRPLIEQTRVWPQIGPSEEFRRFSDLLKQRMKCEHLSEAGWSPIEDVAAAGREVRRASFDEGRLALRVPAVALERAANGEATVTLSIDNPARRYRASVPAAEWASVVGQDATAFAPASPRPADPSRPPPSCHGWFATIEAADAGQARIRDAHQCSGEVDGPALAYGVRLARIAVDYLPQCAAAKAGMADQADAPLQALAKCAGRFEPRTLD